MAGPLKMLGSPLKLSAHPPSIHTPPPTLGQHTDKILADLGISSEEIVNLRERGVVK